MRYLSLSALALASAVFLAGCDIFGTDEVDEVSAARVVVANHGNPEAEDGSITSYDLQSGEATQEVEDVGSTVQSITPLAGQFYVASTSANRLDVYNQTSFTHVTTIDDLPSPRQLLQVSERDAIVSTQPEDEGSTLRAIDLLANDITSTHYFTDGRAHTMTVSSGLIFAAIGARGADDAFATAEVAVADPNDLRNPLNIDCFAHYLLTGRENTVVVPCNTEEGQGEIVIIDAEELEVASRIAMDGTVGGNLEGRIAARSERSNDLFLILDGQRLARINLSEGSVEEVLGPFEGAPLEAVALDEVNDHLYLARVPGFDEAGEVTIHAFDGELLDRFDAGIAPLDIHVQYTRD